MLNFHGLKKAVGDLSAQIKNLRSEIETLQRRREDLAFMPANKDDVFDMLSQWIDSEREKYHQHLEHSLKPYFRKPLDATAVYPQGVDIVTATMQGHPCNFRFLQSNMLYFFGDQIKAGLRDAIDKTELSNDTPRLHERLQELQKLDNQIAKYESDERELILQAKSLGITIGVAQ